VAGGPGQLNTVAGGPGQLNTVAADAGYTAQPSDLQSAAPQYDWVSQQLQYVYNTLSLALDAEGACWGNDDQGQAFGAKYCPLAISALQQMSNTNQGVQSMVDSICTWAKNYVNADEAAQASAAQVGSDTGQ